MIYFFIVSFVFGVISKYLFELSTAEISFFLILLLTSSILIKKENKILFLIFIFIAIGFSLGFFRSQFINTSSRETLEEKVGQIVNLEGKIINEPDRREASTRYTFYPKENGVEENDSLIILIAERFPQFEYGEIISVSGRLDKPKNFIAGGGEEFDYVSYLMKDKIHFLIYKPEIKKIGQEKNNIKYFLYSLKNKFSEKIEKVVPEPNSSLISGIILGMRQSIEKELLENFREVGLIHIVVLSGYNITIIAAGIFYITSFFGKRKTGFIVSAISIILFSIMVGSGSTVIRATIMSIISILSIYLGRPKDSMRWLFIAGFIMILWNPLILFYDPSFHLSFMATLGLIMFSSPINSKLLTPAIDFLENYKYLKWIKFFTKKFGVEEIISSTLAVQIFILPLLIKMSGSFSLVSLFINPLLLPLVPPIMVSGSLTGFFGFIPIIGKFLSFIFGSLSFFLTQIIIYVVEKFSSLDFANIDIGEINMILIIVWYIFSFFIYKKITHSEQKSI